jgi:hypothetical protein
MVQVNFRTHVVFSQQTQQGYRATRYGLTRGLILTIGYQLTRGYKLTRDYRLIIGSIHLREKLQVGVIGYLNLRRYMPPSNRHPNSRFCLDRIAQPQLSAIPIYPPSRSARPRRRPRHQTPAARPPALFIPLHTSLRVSNAQALHRQPWPKRSPSPLRASR